MDGLDRLTWIQLAYALGVGTLLGLERSLDRERAEARHTGDDGTRTAEVDEYLGIRSFVVLSLAGYVGALVGETVPFIPAIVLLASGLLVLGMYFRAVEEGTGITTEVAAVTACALGMLCRSQPQTAAVVGLLVTVFLASKRFTHDTVARMRRVELTDTLKFLVIILIVLPLLPNEPLDPYGALDPYKTGLLVVLISGISFVGYFSTRWFGARRGLALTGIVGGLTSSTAVTAAMAQQAKRHREWTVPCAAATLAANATMFVRVLVIVAFLDLDLLGRLAWSLGTMAVVVTIAAVVLTARGQRSETPTESPLSLSNPLSLGPALTFAAFFVVILFVVELARHSLGERGLYLAAGLSGLADVDAITLSVSGRVGSGDIELRVATLAITIAVVSNSVTKSVIALSTGGWRFGVRVAVGLGVATGAGLAVAVFWV